MKFTMTLLNISMLHHKSKKIIAYQLTNHVYATSRLNTKDVINFIYQKTFKSIILKF